MPSTRSSTRPSLAFGLMLAGVCVSLGVTPALRGQVVPKIPPKPDPAPEYVPPPPPPPPTPAPPPEPEIPAPQLVQRDASGKLIPIEGGVEQAAVRAMTFDADRRAKVDASINARNAEIEKFVLENLDKIDAAIKARAGLEKVTDFEQLVRAKDAALPLKQDNLLDRLQRDGAIGGPHRASLDRAISAYTEARRRDWESQTGTDVMKIATLVGQQGFNDATTDALAAFDRMLVRAAPALASGEHQLSLDKQQEVSLGEMKGMLTAPGLAGSKESIDRLRAFAMTTLTREQAKSLLTRFVTPIAK